MHIFCLRHPYTAKSVAELFAKEIIKLHGMLKSIVSDRNPIFLSHFLSELFRLQGTHLKMSTAYHPETDGQTKILNRSLETYLRCFTFEQPYHWSKWISWAEYSYNSSFHSATEMTPFQAVYGRPPPTPQQFLPGETKTKAVAQESVIQDELLRQLTYNLKRAQQQMARSANKHRRDVQYEVGDSVFLKFRPHHQTTLKKVINPKLSPCYFSPFHILQKVRSVAYKLQLPTSAKIHPIFHVSQLKKVVGKHPVLSTRNGHRR